MMDLAAPAFDTDVGHKVEYKIRDLGTRSVTLFPTQAQVKREIKDVPLKPGVNEISIVGLSPTIDKNSVTVEGSGAATITGISVEFLPNRELFDEVYPDSDDNDDSDSDDEEEGEGEPPEVPQHGELLETKMKLIELKDEQQRAREIIGNADERIKVLDIYSKSLDKREGVNISEMLDTYKQEHQKAFEERLVGVQRERELTEAINKVTKEQMRLNKLGNKFQKKEAKNKARIQKAVQKKQEQRQKRQEEKRKEKERIRNERSRCWPLFCYTIHIQLEVSSSYTPASSRRESVSSEVELVQRPRSKTADLEETSSCNLVLSYVTNSAFWTPSYDIQLSTVDSTGTLCFDAGLHNTTSETWENCKITLSTSQATSSSLDESIPSLTPWRIKLGNKKSSSAESGAFESVPSLEFQNSLVEETGFTTTFDLPGLKTLVPKFTVSKQRVARLQFTNVLFSHTIVAKYQPAAYLKAKLKNNSKLTLLRGPASLTLDGSFMGQTKIPRCSSGEVFTLSLGVDSAIRVMYPKPDVRRSTSGVFSKEDSSVYVRAVTVHNTRVTAKKPISLLVLDQIPVSEDDRLRVELLSPRGLTVEGPRQATGAPGRETAEDKDWGKAMASLKKSGQVSWEVSLNAGKAVKLGLEYSVSMPSGDVAKEC
ncbi:hypothetical protein FOFC_12591 [Fusarium oxysporum]|nr:hypothetical protein FOFC_12591 [Fusarium oxysporum]